MEATMYTNCRKCRKPLVNEGQRVLGICTTEPEFCSADCAAWVSDKYPGQVFPHFGDPQWQPWIDQWLAAGGPERENKPTAEEWEAAGRNT